MNEVNSGAEGQPEVVPEVEVAPAEECPQDAQEVLDELDAGEPVTREEVHVQEVVDNVDELPALELKANATQAFSTISPREIGTPDNIDIPAAGGDIIRERLNNLPNVDMVVSENQQRWADTLKTSLHHVPMAGMFTDRMNMPNAKFVQEVGFNGQGIRGRSASFSNKTGGTHVVDGERALLQMVAHLGTGGLFRAPMWGSGLWVTFRPATEDEMIELNRVIQADRIAMGRWSYGLALSNSVVYTLDRVFDFVLDHVYNTSAKSDELPIDKLRDYIVPQDIYSFIWGFLCANYPSGFHYQTSCINDAVKCNHVMEATLNVSKLQWTDESVLTEWQKQHMSSMATNTKTLDSIRRYQEESKSAFSRRVLINEGTKHELAITLKTPTVTQYIEQGHKWIGGIVDSVNRALSVSEDDEERNRMVNRMGKASMLCQYIHWFESIEYGNLTGPVDNPDDRSISIVKDQASIQKNLTALSSTDSVREEIIAAVKKYINDTTISIIGVPSYDCPACGHAYDGPVKFPRTTSVVPLDLFQVFFALLTQRLSRIEIR